MCSYVCSAGPHSYLGMESCMLAGAPTVKWESSAVPWSGLCCVLVGVMTFLTLRRKVDFVDMVLFVT